MPAGAEVGRGPRGVEGTLGAFVPKIPGDVLLLPAFDKGLRIGVHHARLESQ